MIVEKDLKNKETEMAIPRCNDKYVKGILNSDIDNLKKAEQIHRYDYNCLCRETDGRIVQEYSKKEILEAIECLEK